MRVNYKYAVLSFCGDLTDPQANSQPLAVVGVGDADNEPGFWFYVSKFRPGDSLDLEGDEFSRSLLNDLPQLVKSQFEQAFKQIGAGDFVAWLDDRLRNSLHVSAVTERTEELQLDKFVSGLVRLFEAEVAPQTKEQMGRVPVIHVGPLAEARA